MIKKVFYISFSKLEYSVNAVYVKGLEQNGIIVRGFCIGKSGGYVEALKEYRKNRNSIDLIIVGYNSPQLIFWSKLLSSKKVVYNALCSVYERMIVSRALAPRISIKSLYYWLIDFIAVHLADLVMLETNEQINYFKKIFKVSMKKCFRAWTGVDEDKFFYDPSVVKSDIFTVIFRGGLLPESGAEYVVQAAKILEGENIKIIMHANDQDLPRIKKLVVELKPNNFQLITDFLPDDELRVLMQKSHLSLGQLSNHPRLIRTIPHKCYESLALKLPYLTASNKGIMELLKPGETCLACSPADPKSLAEQIMWAKEYPQELEKIAENGYQFYKERLTSEVLTAELLERIREL